MALQLAPMEFSLLVYQFLTQVAARRLNLPLCRASTEVSRDDLPVTRTQTSVGSRQNATLGRAMRLTNEPTISVAREAASGPSAAKFQQPSGLAYNNFRFY